MYWVRSIGIAVAVGVTYFLAARLSFGLRIPPENVIYWPAAGISSGVLISLWSIARWPVLVGMVIATIAVNLLQHFSVAATAAWVVGNTAEPLIIAGLIQYYFGANFKIEQLYCVLGLAAAAVVGTAVSATWWTFAYYWLFASLKEPTVAWLHWIISDLAGIISVAPLVIGLAAAVQRSLPRREAIESISALAVLGGITGLIVSLLPAEAWETVVPAALVFPMLLWLAARCQPVFAAAGAFIVSITVALTAIYGLGHFGDTALSIAGRILQTQAIILVVSFGTAVLAALFAERRESEARLARSNVLLQREQDNKLLNAQTIVAAIAHEVRQPLTRITAGANAAQRFLKMLPPQQDKAQTALEGIANAGHRTSEVIDGFRAVFTKSDQMQQLVDISEVIRAVLESLSNELGDHDIEPRCELTSALPHVYGNRSQLEEVVSNLIVNAIEAMETTRSRDRVLRVRTERCDEKAIAVVIEDSGPGIDKDKLASIFTPFVTTKGRGTGLGLAISRMIVEYHGGKLTASSDPKGGATFQFILPVVSAGKERAGAEHTIAT